MEDCNVYLMILSGIELFDDACFITCKSISNGKQSKQAEREGDPAGKNRSRQRLDRHS
jgi:hypothetical protein